MAEPSCDDLNYRDYVDNLVKGAIACAIELLDNHETPLADMLRLAESRLNEVLEARAAPGEEVQHGQA